MSEEKNKGGRPKKKHAGGRPPKITPTVLSKLEQAFLMGCSDREACLFGNVSTTTLYEYCVKNPEFAERKEVLKLNPVLKARGIVIKALDDDGNIIGQQMTADKVINRYEGIKQRLEHANADGKPFQTETKTTFNFIPVDSND